MTEKLNSSDVAQGLDSANELIFGRTPQDLIVGLFGPIFVLIFLSILDLVGTYSFFILLILIIVNCVVLFRLAGPGTPVVEYLHGRLVQIRRPSQVSMFEVDEKSQSDAVPYPDGGETVTVTDNSGQPNSHKPWQEPRDVEETLGIKTVFPEDNLIKRTDGTYVTALKVSGTNLFLRSQTEKNRLAEQFQAGLNQIDDDLMVFLTTSKFEITDHAESHAEAEQHPAIQRNPALRALHSDYKNSILTDRRVQSTAERDIYVILTSDPGETESIEDDVLGLRSLISRLLGSKPSSSTPSQDSSAEDEKHHEAVSRLAERRHQAIRNISRVKGVELEPVSSETLLGELRGHFTIPVNNNPVSPDVSHISHITDQGESDRQNQGGLQA